METMCHLPAGPAGGVGADSPLKSFSDVVRPPAPLPPGWIARAVLANVSAPNWRSALRCGAPPPRPPLPRDRFPSIARMRCRFAGAGSTAAAADPAARWPATLPWRYEVH